MTNTPQFPPIPAPISGASPFYGKSIELAESKDFNNALTAINEAIRMEPEEINFYNYRGFIYYNLNEFQQAVNSYDFCINLNPNNRDFWNNRNLALAKCKDTTSLELGCGIHHKNPFDASASYGIDIREDLDAKILKADLTVEPIPFPDNYFDFVVAEHFLEHIPRFKHHVLYYKKHNKILNLVAQ
jgi:tetratricopeptide (TPR) repeat protein